MAPSPELKHFLELARTADGPGESGASVAAYGIAAALIIAVPVLDASAVAGLHEFIDLAKAAPTTAEEILT